MGTRYVWEKYNTKESYIAVKDRENTSFQIQYAVVYAGYSYSITGDGKFEIIPESSYPIGDAGDGPLQTQITKKYPYVKYGDTFLFHAKEPSSGDRWVLKRTREFGEENPFMLYPEDINGDQPSGTIIELFEIGTGDPIQGDLIGKVSSNSNGGYPTNGIDSGYWYKYLGQDNIDPSSVTYSPVTPNPGYYTTVKVAKKSPTYGGTIYYQFSYSTDGGTTWVNIGSKTTNTSVSVKIPTGAKQFKARVLASDGWGFTSATYVYGGNATTNGAPTSPAYVTVPNDVYIGDSFQVSWDASVDPDGNLSGYEVQKVYDGGSTWETVASNVTGTSLTDTVQEGHTSVQYRVRAKDSNGLTSSWALSGVALIGQLKAYAAVSGINRAGVKMYATVNGKIREIQKGYATVGGIIRKLF